MRTETGCGGVRRRSCHPASVGGMVVVPGVEGCVPAPLSAPDGRAAVTARGPDPAIRSSWLRVCALKNDLLASRVPLHVWEDQRAQNCACQCPTPNAQSESLTHTHTHTHAHTPTHTHTHTRTHAHAHAHTHTHCSPQRQCVLHNCLPWPAEFQTDCFGSVSAPSLRTIQRPGTWSLSLPVDVCYSHFEPMDPSGLPHHSPLRALS